MKCKIVLGTVLFLMRLCFLFSTILLCVLFSFVFSVYAPSYQEAAISSISEAEESIVHAYTSILDAERSGVNISALLVKLNHATMLLSDARTAFETGNLDEVAALAERARQVGLEVESEAASLKAQADHARSNRAKEFTVGSALGLSIVVGASLLSYRHFKRFYYGRLLKRKPKVEQA